MKTKTIKHLGLAIVLAIATIFTSCSSDGDGGSGGGSAALGTLKAKVGGSNFTSMSMATFASRQTVGGLTNVVVQGSDASGKAIQLIIAGATVGAGTYEISNNATISAIASYTEVNISNPSASQTWAAPYEASGVVGSIIITEITATNIKGTFSFTPKNQSGSDTKTITNGAFNVNFSS